MVWQAGEQTTIGVMWDEQEILRGYALSRFLNSESPRQGATTRACAEHDAP